MRRIAIINQKGGVGKTTTCTNLGAALALQGRRVVLIDMDAQAHLSLCLDIESAPNSPSTYTVLTGQSPIAAALRDTSIPNLRVLPSNIDLSGAEIELASAFGREYLLRDALRDWESEHTQTHGRPPSDYLIFDCPPSLGLLSINALSACREVIIALQTEFLALQGMSKLMEILQVLRRRMNPEIEILGILPCLYDSRLKLAREVLGEIRAYFPGQVFRNPIRSNVKLAEAPSFGKTVFEYAPDSNGAQDYLLLAQELVQSEARHADLAHLPAFTFEPPTRARETAEPAKASADAPLPIAILPAPSTAPRVTRSVPIVEERTGSSASGTPASSRTESRPASPARGGAPDSDLALEPSGCERSTAVMVLDEPPTAKGLPDAVLVLAQYPAHDEFADIAFAELPALPDEAVEIGGAIEIALESQP